MKISNQPRGTRILIGDEADRFTRTCDTMASVAEDLGARRIILPAIDGADCYVGKPGERMGVTGPSADTVLCPERTDQIRRLFREHEIIFPIYYIERCYRLERPQFGRWREFTQFGMEWRGSCGDLNWLVAVAQSFVRRLGIKGTRYLTNADRGLDYYTGNTFEIHATVEDKSLQIAGGGSYPEGFGFAFGVERVILAAGQQA